MNGNSQKEREKRHQLILEGAVFRWLNAHSNELLDYLRQRLSDEITAAETIPDETENSC